MRACVCDLVFSPRVTKEIGRTAVMTMTKGVGLNIGRGKWNDCVYTTYGRCITMYLKSNATVTIIETDYIQKRKEFLNNNN